MKYSVYVKYVIKRRVILSKKLVNIHHLRSYTLNKNTLNTRIKLLDWRKTTHNCRVMGCAWVLLHFFDHTRAIYPTHFAGNPYTARIKATITPTLCSVFF